MSQSWKSQCPLSVLKQRAFLLAHIRQFFNDKNVLEVETPILSSSGNTDINIESFTSENINSNYLKSYLRTSPEFPLKRLLCSGIKDVFEIGKVFRRGEYSKTHNCEFTMLEWYRIDFKYMDLIQEVEELFKCLFMAFEIKVPKTKIVTFNQCFMKQLEVDIFKASKHEFNLLCNKFNYSGTELSKDEALDYLFALQIQPHFNQSHLTFVTHYPASQAALAEINPEDQNTSLRFEVFYNGHELGNGYQELTDADELESRFLKDNRMRNVSQFDEVQIDFNLIDAMKTDSLQKGLPQCSGIAMGVDRLLMVLLGSESIQQVLPFNALNS